MIVNEKCMGVLMRSVIISLQKVILSCVYISFFCTSILFAPPPHCRLLWRGDFQNCYMISVLHPLSNIKPLTEYLLRKYPKGLGGDPENPTASCNTIPGLYIDILRQMRDAKRAGQIEITDTRLQEKFYNAAVIKYFGKEQWGQPNSAQPFLSPFLEDLCKFDKSITSIFRNTLYIGGRARERDLLMVMAYEPASVVARVRASASPIYNMALPEPQNSLAPVVIIWITGGVPPLPATYVSAQCDLGTLITGKRKMYKLIGMTTHTPHHYSALLNGEESDGSWYFYDEAWVPGVAHKIRPQIEAILARGETPQEYLDHGHAHLYPLLLWYQAEDFVAMGSPETVVSAASGAPVDVVAPVASGRVAVPPSEPPPVPYKRVPKSIDAPVKGFVPHEEEGALREGNGREALSIVSSLLQVASERAKRLVVVLCKMGH
jgi:hypothetical protein